MNRREVLTGSVVAGGAAVAAFKLDVASFGALGDGRNDDAPAIQAALDQLGAKGGGVALLVPPKVNYRLATGLKLPSNVVLEGPAPVQYPFNAGNPGACALVADFADARQWVIEPKTLAGGKTFAYDKLVAESLPDGVTYNCGVKNLLITSKGKVPFGGIRMHGCPGSFVEGVSIDRVGCGLLVNFCFGGHFKVHVHSLYYGVAAWDDANANSFEIYCAHSVPWPKTVPADYRLPFMRQLDGHFADTLKLYHNEHGARPYGLLVGSIGSTSIGNTVDAVVERYPGGIFMFNAYATDFGRCYLEADNGVMACGIAATRSRFSIAALHAFMSGSGMVFDLGINVLGKVFASGILHAATFGKPPFDDGDSLLLLEGVDPTMPGVSVQRGIRLAGREPAWVPLGLQAGWRVAPDHDAPAVRLDPWSHRVELRGAMAGGARGACFTLPAACRPAKRRRLSVAGGQIAVAPDGTVEIAADGGVGLDGVSFPKW